MTCKQIQELTAAPGLLLWNHFAEDPDMLFTKAWGIASAVSALAKSSKAAFVSPDHNLPNRKEEYVSVALPDEESDHVLRCEHFPNYGDGHQLTYFRGTRNLPSAVLPLVDQLEALPAIREEVRIGRERLGRRADAPFEWRLTLNRYLAGTQNERVGFPWHRDIEANGASTMILGLGTSGRLQFAESPEDRPKLDGLCYEVAPIEPCVDLTLPPGDLLALTGKARWEMIHRVVGGEHFGNGGGDAAAAGGGGGAFGKKARLSIVLGCW